MFIAGVVAIIGAAIDWVTVSPPEILPAAEADRAVPFTGLEARDGWWILGGGVILVVCAVELVLRRSSGYAWLAFVVSIVVGGAAIAAYRAVGDSSSALVRRMDRVGELDPAAGVYLVATAAVLGLIAAVIGIAASPRRR